MNSKQLKSYQLKRYNDAKIFNDALVMLRFARGIIRNASKDDKICFGNACLSAMNDFCLNYRAAYDCLDNSKKLELVLKLADSLKDIEARVNILRECYVINIASAAHCLKKISEMSRQITNWYHRLDDAKAAN